MSQDQQQTTERERDEAVEETAPEGRDEDVQTLIEETDDLLDEIDEVLAETELDPDDYHQEGGE